MISMPSLAKTASKSRVNLLSRSRIRKRNDARPLLECPGELARLLGDPGAGRVRGAAGEVDAAAAELDEEEHVQPLQRDRLDGEEVDREHALRLRPQEGTPGQPRALAGRAESRLRAGSSRRSSPTRRSRGRSARRRSAGSPSAGSRAPAAAPARGSRSPIGGRPQRPPYVQRRATRRRCQRSSVAGVTMNDRQLGRGSSRLAAASNTRSAIVSCGRPA